MKTETPPTRFEERLLRELRTLVAEQPLPTPPPRQPVPRRRMVALAAALACVGIAMIAFAPGQSSRLQAGTSQAWAASAVRVANAVPRLVVGEPGWRVVRADEFRVDEGEMTFASGRHRLDLHWRSGSSHGAFVADRAASSQRLPDVEVAGRTATVFKYDGTKDDYTALWRSGGYSLELRTGLSDADDRLDEREFADLLRSLRSVGVEEWLAAMPASVVRPDGHDATVAGMLEGVPLPEGFDRRRLRSAQTVRDRYQLGARVAGEVACSWIRQWLRARRTGDERAAAEAVAAMRTSRRWPVLREMSRDGFYPHAVWEFADAMNGDGRIRAGKVLTVREAYKSSLGC